MAFGFGRGRLQEERREAAGFLRHRLKVYSVTYAKKKSHASPDSRARETGYLSVGEGARNLRPRTGRSVSMVKAHVAFVEHNAPPAPGAPG